MKRITPFFLILSALVLFLASCQNQASDTSPEAVSAVFQKGGCVACHIIPGVPGAVGTIGPDLSRMGEIASAQVESNEYTGSAKNALEFIRESIMSPDTFISPECPNGPCTAGQMPSTLADLLSDKELDIITNYLASLPNNDVAISEESTTAVGEAPSLTEAEWEKATQIFFDRCAGCHGVLRNGATGPALTPDKTLPKGTAGLAAIIFNGTPRGMPDWGKQGTLTQEETELMAKFIQNEPPQPPEMSLDQMKASWNEVVPVDQRPTQPQTTRDWENYFIVTLRDAGKVAIIDGDNYEIVNEVSRTISYYLSDADL